MPGTGDSSQSSCKEEKTEVQRHVTSGGRMAWVGEGYQFRSPSRASAPHCLSDWGPVLVPKGSPACWHLLIVPCLAFSFDSCNVGAVHPPLKLACPAENAVLTREKDQACAPIRVSLCSSCLLLFPHCSGQALGVVPPRLGAPWSSLVPRNQQHKQTCREPSSNRGPAERSYIVETWAFVAGRCHGG